MKYYAAISKDEALVLTKEEWKAFSKVHPGFHAKRYDTKEEAEDEVKKSQKIIYYKEAAKPISNKYICFYDSEFNACDYNNGMTQEVVSIGIVIMDRNGNQVDEYYSTIRLKAARKLTRRCRRITGLTEEDMIDAPPFYIVCERVAKMIEKYKVLKIYCLGKEDIGEFRDTSKLYRPIPEFEIILNKLTNVRDELKNMSNPQVASLSLDHLKLVCEISGTAEHHALQDAKDLAEVYYKLKTFGYSEKILKDIMKNRNDANLYHRSRNIGDDEHLYVDENIYQAKETLVDFLLKQNDPHLNKIVVQALADDINTLIKYKEGS